MLNRYLTIPFAVLGDSLVLVVSLFLALFLRAQALPRAEFFATHAIPFFLVLATSVCVFFTIGLYDIHSIVHRRTLFSKIVYAQGINAIFSFLFFYIITVWGITPKTILLLYVVLSSLLLGLWRAQIFPKLVHSIPKEHALLIAEENEGRELYSVLSANSPYPIEIVETFFVKSNDDLASVKTFFDILPQKLSGQNRPDVVIVDMRNSQIAKLSQALYEYAGSGGKIRSFTDTYESVFDKITESTLREDSIVTYLYGQNKGYDAVKRLTDICIASPLFILSLPFYAFVWVGIKLQDGGQIFFTHDRMGRGGKRIKLYKFRSMTFGDTSATWVKTEGNQNRVTRFGAFIRKTRIDELPQLWNVLRGDMSLVGPRPDIWALGVKSAEDIPFYKARLVVTPGLSGWAQTHMHTPPQNMEQTKERLLYDLYYVKNTSISLDILIALKTIKTLLSREGM